MRFYPYHIGDFNNATRYASRVERSIYRDLLDMYYEQESAIDGTNMDKLQRRLNVRSTDEQAALLFVLTEFFEDQDGFYFNNRCEFEIKKYQDKLEGAIKAGKASAEARRKKAAKKQRKGHDEQGLEGNSTDVEQTLNDSSTNVQPTNEPMNQEPMNQEPSLKDICEASEKTDAELLVEFWNDNRPSNAQVKASVWSKVVKTRLKTFTADEIKQAMLTVINGHWYQVNNEVSIKNAVDSDKRCASVLEKSNQQTNKQGNQYANSSANNSQGHQPTSHFDKLRAEAAAKYSGRDNGIITVS